VPRQPVPDGKQQRVRVNRHHRQRKRLLAARLQLKPDTRRFTVEMTDRAGRNGEPLQRRAGSRKSIAHTQSWSAGSGEDKENMTADVAAMTGMKRKSSTTEKPAKKLRSKSIGPGGIDAIRELAVTDNKVGQLTSDPGNLLSNALSQTTSVIPIKSILKPTIPLSPLREIPSYPLQAGSQRKLRGRRATGNYQGGQPADSTSSADRSPAPATVNDIEKLASPFNTGVSASKVNDGGCSDEAGHVSAEELREKELRDKERREVLERREARRKSLGASPYSS
jgi:kinetochore protein Spc7/SPC105